MEKEKMNDLITYDVSGATIEEIKKRYLPLEVKGFDDKEGYEECKKARVEVKTLRVSIEKRRKELKKDSLEFGRMVDGKAKELSAPLEEVEAHLKAQQDIIDAEKKRRKEEAERKERERVEGMFKTLVSVGINNLTMGEVAAMKEDEFEARVEEARKAKEEREAAEAEEKRKHDIADKRWRTLATVGHNHANLHELIEMTEEEYQELLVSATEAWQKREEERIENERKMAEQEAENRRLQAELEAQQEEARKLREAEEERQRLEAEEAEKKEQLKEKTLAEIADEVIGGEITADVHFAGTEEQQAQVLLSLSQEDIDALKRIHEELDLTNAESQSTHSEQRYEDLVRLGTLIESLEKMFNLKGAENKKEEESASGATETKEADHILEVDRNSSDYRYT